MPPAHRHPPSGGGVVHRPHSPTNGGGCCPPVTVTHQRGGVLSTGHPTHPGGGCRPPRTPPTRGGGVHILTSGGSLPIHTPAEVHTPPYQAWAGGPTQDSWTSAPHPPPPCQPHALLLSFFLWCVSLRAGAAVAGGQEARQGLGGPGRHYGPAGHSSGPWQFTAGGGGRREGRGGGRERTSHVLASLVPALLLSRPPPMG